MKYKMLIFLFLGIIGIVIFSATGVRTIGDSREEPSVDLFKQVEPLVVEGYSENAMEPCLSADGKYLLFNDSNAPESISKIHVSRRVMDSKFKYLGKLSGVASNAKDLAPSMDDFGNIYFTSLREYPKTLKSLFCGKFENEKVLDVRAIEGDISSRIPGWLNMDCEVSRDGKLLCFSRARFEPGGHVPVESDLLLAQVIDGKVIKIADSDLIMKNINTEALEYAPAFARNGLEIYFNRSNILMAGNTVKGAEMRIMLSKRESLEKPFGPPAKLKNIDGLVEGATLSGDGSELIFHKKVGKSFRLFRACERN